MKRVQAILVPAVLGAAFLLSACGGDDSPEQPIVIPTTSTTSSLGGGEFIEEADALCEEANSAIQSFVDSGEGFSAASDIAAIRENLLTDIQGLGGEPSPDLDAFLSGLEAQVAAGEKIGLANERGEDTAEFETELDNAQAETLTAAESYGFEVCGQEPGSTSSTSSTPDTGVAAPSSEPVAPVAPAPAPSAPDTSGGGVGDTGGDTGDTGGSGGGVSPGGGVGPG